MTVTQICILNRSLTVYKINLHLAWFCSLTSCSTVIQSYQVIWKVLIIAVKHHLPKNQDRYYGLPYCLQDCSLILREPVCHLIFSSTPELKAHKVILTVYQWFVVHSHFQTWISLREGVQSWSNFMCSITGVGESYISIWDRSNQNSGFHGNRTRPLTYIMGKTMSPRSCLQFWSNLWQTCT